MIPIYARCRQVITSAWVHNRGSACDLCLADDHHPRVVAQRLTDDSVTKHIGEVYPQDKGWGASVEPLRNDFLPKEEIEALYFLIGWGRLRPADRPSPPEWLPPPPPLTGQFPDAV
jgi:hypothetical protein